ncbi:MAG TPA: PaaI family thioesterase [Longimicrobiales bacterium]
METTRSRTIIWEDPAPFGRAAPSLSGLDFLRAIGSGELPEPPMMRTLGIEAIEVEEGRAVFAAEPQEYHYNPLGVVHGGFTAALADTAMGCAVHSLLPKGVGYTTLEVKVNFVRPLRAGMGRVRCEGSAVHVGSRVATAEARVVDDAGRIYAHATTTCLILRPSGDGGG